MMMHGLANPKQDHISILFLPLPSYTAFMQHRTCIVNT